MLSKKISIFNHLIFLFIFSQSTTFFPYIFFLEKLSEILLIYFCFFYWIVEKGNMQGARHSYKWHVLNILKFIDYPQMFGGLYLFFLSWLLSVDFIVCFYFMAAKYYPFSICLCLMLMKRFSFAPALKWLSKYSFLVLIN